MTNYYRQCIKGYATISLIATDGPYPKGGSFHLGARRTGCIRPTQRFAELAIPWGVDNLDQSLVLRDQQKKFPDFLVEASQDMDDSLYLLQNNLLYSISPPYSGTERYPVCFSRVATEIRSSNDAMKKSPDSANRTCVDTCPTVQ
ncbi:hypothetical protein CAPTEDRAFT_192360 [Capitella teleta]|uniref:Uncharacterized protein n=1 Tax=Capitella teleta TaxID=283909 RepID=R7ULG3_CAPTE|nr:hypothetical protein CAPTEDRAFT_192360 [Capitella teleta]|eukprot:ELU07379.1 hypothetical protein CAPTEDRAFT_192360 [Capitella teleta]